MDLLKAYSDILNWLGNAIVWTVPKALIVMFLAMVFQTIMLVYLKWITKIPVVDGYMELDPKSWHFKFIYGKEVRKRESWHEENRNHKLEFLESLTVKMCPYAAKIWLKFVVLTLWYPLATIVRWVICFVVSIVSIILIGVRLKSGAWTPGATFKESTGCWYSPEVDDWFVNFEPFHFQSRIHVRPGIILIPAVGLFFYIKALVDGVPWVMYLTAVLLVILLVVLLGILLWKADKKSNENQTTESLLSVSKKSLWNKVCPLAKVKIEIEAHE